MTRREQAKHRIESYTKMLENKRGHNFAYLTDELDKYFEEKGYNQCVFSNKRDTTNSESTAVEAAIEFRNQGYYARVVCIANQLRIKEYAVFYREKK